MKYRFIKVKSGVDIIQDPDGLNKKIGNAKDQSTAAKKLNDFIRGK